MIQHNLLLLLRDVIKYNWADARAWAVLLSLSLCISHESAKRAALDSGMAATLPPLFDTVSLESEVTTTARLLVVLCEADPTGAAGALAQASIIAPLLSFLSLALSTSTNDFQSSENNVICKLSLLCVLLRADDTRILFPECHGLVELLTPVLARYANLVDLCCLFSIF